MVVDVKVEVVTPEVEVAEVSSFSFLDPSISFC